MDKLDGISALLYNDDKLVEIKTKIHKIVKVSEWADPD